MSKLGNLSRTNERRSQLAEMSFMRHTAGFWVFELGNKDRIGTELRNTANIVHHSIRETVKNMMKAGALIGAHKAFNMST
jgi:hypothetical protein